MATVIKMATKAQLIAELKTKGVRGALSKMSKSQLLEKGLAAGTCVSSLVKATFLTWSVRQTFFILFPRWIGLTTPSNR